MVADREAAEIFGAVLGSFYKVTSTSPDFEMVGALAGQIALVTGASRGIGRGIALQLGQAGATVYITGRQPSASLQSTRSHLPLLETTAQEVRDRGGECIPVYVDHTKQDEVASLFARIAQERDGRLDILVNNAFSAVGDLAATAGKPFFEADPSLWDSVNDVGLRNHYYCAVHASRLMVARKKGLIVNISSIGGLQYAFNVAYGCGKAALDRMAADMGVELGPHGVSIVSLWPGVVRTEMTHTMQEERTLGAMMQRPDEVLDSAVASGETVEFAGLAVVALASDKNIAKKNGKILSTADVAREHGFVDIDGKKPADLRSVSTSLSFFGWRRLGSLVPSFLRVPYPALHFGSYKYYKWW